MNVCFCICQFLEWGGHIYGVVILQEPVVCLLEISLFDQVVCIFAIIGCLEKGRGEGVGDGMPDESEFLHCTISDYVDFLSDAQPHTSEWQQIRTH